MATTTITKTEKLVGKRIRRREDPRLITGTATYVDDIKMPGMLYASILRSPHAAAKIRSIDISKAKALKGVHAVFIGEDTKDAGAVPCGASLPGLRVPHHNILAIDRVYLVGHPVAVVVATDRYIARDGVELIEVDYEVRECRGRSRKGARARRTRGASAVARQRRIHVPPGRRRRRQGVRRSRRDRQAAHHQPAADSEFHGNARRGGRLACGRSQP